MLVLVIGDSHVDNLGASGPDYFEYRSQRVDVEYYGIRGATFQTYTKNGNDELLNVAGKYQPSIVVTFIGGNAIKTAVSNEKIFEQSERFHKAISEIFPGALVVSSQIEKREYKPGNKFGCPVGQEHKRRRVAYNHFLKALKYKHHVMMINGPGRMDNPDLYSKDRIHFNKQGYLKLYNIIKATIKFVADTHKLL